MDTAPYPRKAPPYLWGGTGRSVNISFPGHARAAEQTTRTSSIEDFAHVPLRLGRRLYNFPGSSIETNRWKYKGRVFEPQTGDYPPLSNTLRIQQTK